MKPAQAGFVCLAATGTTNSPSVVIMTHQQLLQAVYFFYRQVHSGLVVETLVEKQTLGVKVGMKIGDRVRVKDSVVVYHHPEHRGKGFDLKGAEGEVVGVINQWQGKPVSANLPIYVQFSKKFKAHLRDTELELI